MSGLQVGPQPASTEAPSNPGKPTPRDLGLLGPVALVVSVGAALAAFAAAGARLGESWARPVFWLALLVIAAPTFARVASSRSRPELVGLVLVFTIGLYLVKIAYDPRAFSFSDEFVHWRSTLALLRTGDLFSFNPLLPIAAHYPGLPSATAALHELTGLHIPAAGFIVVGASRLLLILVVFHLVEDLAGSPRAAAIGCLIYACNPNFLYWDAQFSYESLGLSFAFLALLLTYRAQRDPGRVAIWVGLLLVIVATVVTHHLSTYGLLATLAIWWLAERSAQDRVSRSHGVPRLAFLATLLATAFWITAAAPGTLSYVGKIFGSAGAGALDVISGHGGTRKLFTSGATVPPMWERIITYAAVALLLIGLLATLRPAMRRLRSVPLATIGIVLAVAYPLILPLRLVANAQETANRSVEWVFFGLGLVIATVVAFRLPSTLRARWMAVGALLVIFLGGVAVSWQYSEQLPPSTRYTGVPNQVDARAAAVASWTSQALGSGRRFSSDAIDNLALATYGYQQLLWRSVDGVSSWQIFLPRTLSPAVVSAIHRGGVQFLLVQNRLTRGVPSTGVYFNKGEPGATDHGATLSPSSLDKFDFAPGVSRVLDTGDIVVYDVRQIRVKR